MHDFTVYQGTDVTPYVSVTSDGTLTGTPIDVSNWSAATWVAFSLPLTDDQTPSITKHQADMTVGIDPLFDPPSEIQNSVFFPLTNQDLGADGIFGQYRHELRITLYSKQYVVYPLVGIAATFMVDESLSWNATTDPPTPRLVRLGGQPRIDITPQKEEIPEPPAKATKFDREKWRKDHGRPDSVTAKPVYLSANMKQKLWPDVTTIPTLTNPLVIKSGSDHAFVVTLLDSNKNGINLTAVSEIFWCVFKGRGVVLEKCYTNTPATDTITILNPEAGTIVVTLTADETSPPSLGSTTATNSYHHEGRLVFADGTQKVPSNLDGTLRITPTSTWGVSPPDS